MRGPDLRFHALLAGLSFVGVASLLLLPVERLEGVPSDISVAALRLLSIVNPLILSAVGILLGAKLTRRVGLDAPVLRAIADGRLSAPILRSQAFPAVIGAIVVGIVVAVVEAGGRDGPTGVADVLPSVGVRLLYGGITEEVIARWGLMTFVVWATWSLGGRPTPPGAAIYWVGITISALLFALAHLPILFASHGPTLPLMLLAIVLVGNFVAGLVFGWLYWRHGLEAAMLAHMGAHVVALTLSAIP